MQKGIQSRLSIHRILNSLKNNLNSYDELLRGEIKKNGFSNKDINLIQSIVLNSLRYDKHIKTILKKFIKKKINEDSYLLLLSAITQLLYLDFKDYAVVNSTVELAKNKKIKSFPGFINAVLKNIIINKDNLKQTTITASDLPKWFTGEILNFNSEKIIKIIESIIEKPDLHLVFKNQEFMQKFLNVRDNTDVITSKQSLMINKFSKIEDLPRYSDGEWWVQDYSAMLPLYLINDLQNKVVVDLCSAPGGKSFQLINFNSKVDIIEKNINRSKILKDNLKRLNFINEIKIKDALNLNENNKYDVAILDAPCSAVGTIRKNPEIFFRKIDVDISIYTEIQKKLLNKASKIIKKNGVIVYMVCSFLEKETIKQIDIFLESNKNFSVKKFEEISDNELIDKNGYISILPSKLNNGVKIDGFFAARLIKND